MPDFTSLSDEQVIDYLLQNYDDIGAGVALPRTKEDILQDIEIGHVSIEKRRAPSPSLLRQTESMTALLVY